MLIILSLKATESDYDKSITAALMLIPGLKRHDCLVLQQGMGSLAQISRATVEEIIANTSLSAEQAESVVDFFQQDKAR